MVTDELIIVAVSGGVDSAVAALLLKQAGHRVQCLHMTNWEDDGYCDSAREYHDARRVCEQIDVPLHRVNFAKEYREQVFAHFLRELESGRTPNPDVLCNREIKFGVLLDYARRLGASRLATGHYARVERSETGATLHKAADSAKDQTYFLHATRAEQLRDVVFPLGGLKKPEVRAIARTHELAVSNKRDSTGICFIGERPFAEFLGHYLPSSPGPIETLDGEVVGEHCGLPFYTLGQRRGLALGGRKHHRHEPWYVAAKRRDDNALIVVQGHDHPALLSNWLRATDAHWIDADTRIASGGSLRCTAKTRYRQPDGACHVRVAHDDTIEVAFDAPQWSVTPGQYVVLYDGDRCLGGATIEATELRRHTAATAA
jgi:tRNA-uridine 2-sulfurtransferase